jgi:hypothetical protein
MSELAKARHQIGICGTVLAQVAHRRRKATAPVEVEFDGRTRHEPDGKAEVEHAEKLRIVLTRMQGRCQSLPSMPTRCINPRQYCDNATVVAFGKYVGRRLTEVARMTPGMLD